MKGLLDVEGGVSASHSSKCFVVHHRNTCGRMMKGQSTGFRRERKVNLVSVGQHRALGASHRRLNPGEHLTAFFDDVCMATPPARVGPMHAVVQEELFVHACIRVHHGKTKVWNMVWAGSTTQQWTRDQGVRNAHRTSRLRCRRVGVSEKGTRGLSLKNIVHQRCPESMVAACPLRHGTCVRALRPTVVEDSHEFTTLATSFSWTCRLLASLRAKFASFAGVVSRSQLGPCGFVCGIHESPTRPGGQEEGMPGICGDGLSLCHRRLDVCTHD